MSALYKVQAFAELAGVTVRALHHYDRLGLLRPQRTASGYRLYGLRDLERLEEIVALRFLGLSLKQIGTLLNRKARGLPEVLRSQRVALEDKRRLLDQAIDAVRDAEKAVLEGSSGNAAVLKKLIEVIEMQDNTDFTNRQYNDAAIGKLANAKNSLRTGSKRTVWRGRTP